MKKDILLGQFLPYLAMPDVDIHLIDYETNNELICENMIQLFLQDKAMPFYNRKIHCITHEKWNGVYYPESDLIIVLEKEER